MFFCSFLPSDLTVSVWSHCSIKHGTRTESFHYRRTHFVWNHWLKSFTSDRQRDADESELLYFWPPQHFRRESKRRNTYKTCWMKLLWNLNHKLHVEQLSHYSLIHTVAYCGREMDTKTELMKPTMTSKMLRKNKTKPWNIPYENHKSSKVLTFCRVKKKKKK